MPLRMQWAVIGKPTSVASVFLLEQPREIGERPVGRVRRAVGLPGEAARLIQRTLVFIVMAVEAQQFPVAAVGRVVVVVVVLVVHGQQVDGRVVEFPRAAAADPREQFQRLGSVAFFALLPDAPRVGDDLIQALAVGAVLLRGHPWILSFLSGARKVRRTGLHRRIEEAEMLRLQQSRARHLRIATDDIRIGRGDAREPNPTISWGLCGRGRLAVARS
jgi:hypothetical protein